MSKNAKQNSASTIYQLPANVRRIVLLDTHAILHRAYHALPQFTNDKGEPTGALYGLTVMLLSLIKEFKPNAVVACFDLPKPTFRHEKYEAYKAHRQKADQALIDQIIRAPEVFAAFNIPVVSSPGFEADDMLGTIVEQLSKNSELKTKNYQIIIASGDMDTLQLVDDDRVVVYTLRKGIKDTVLYNEAEVEKRYGFKPELLPDYKGLRGDPSDNIIGVKGIGEKTATELIQTYGTIEKMYKELKKHKTQTAQKPQKPNKIQSQKVKVKNNSGSKTSSAGPEAILPKSVTPRIFELLLANEDEAMFSKMLATIRRDAPITFDLEVNHFADNLEPAKVEALFRALSFKSLLSRIKELSPNSESLASNLEEERRPTSAKHGQDVGRLKDQKGKEKTGSLFSAINQKSDLFKRVAIMAWLVNSELTDPTPEQIFAETGTDSLEAAEKKLLPQLEQDGLLRVYDDLELPLIPIVHRAEERGVLIDIDYLGDLGKKYHKELTRLEKEIWKHAGEEFNVNSTKQLGEIIFQKMKLGEGMKGLKKTAGGAASTRESELQKIIGQHVIVRLILEYREYQKLLSTYIDVIPTLVDKQHRLHTRFVQPGTTTGRMASIDPNLQNIPIKTELGKAIRGAFVASPGYKLAAFDYSQIDLRSAAMLSKDPLFIKIFQDKHDVHTSVASVVFKVPPDKVDYEMRRRAKVINFGIIYGMGVNALKQNLSTDRKDAEEFYHTYFDRFPGLRAYLDEQKAIARKQGYTTTYFGRRRYYPNITSPLPYVRAMEERMAMNAPIQGTSADIIKLAMSRADEALKKAKLDDRVFPLLQVHDELIYEIADNSLEQAVPLIREVMERVLPEAPVPLEVHASVGDNWGNLQKV